MKVYGPYLRNDGRKHVILWDGIKTKTVSFPRFLMEQHLGRKLLPDETVDHINGNYLDDRIENLQLLTLKENIKKSCDSGHYKRMQRLAAMARRGKYVGKKRSAVKKVFVWIDFLCHT